MYIFTNINNPAMVHKYVSILIYSILAVNLKKLQKVFKTLLIGTTQLFIID